MLPNFRVRIMPVVGTIPAMFGMVAATYVLNALSEKPFKSMLPAKFSLKKMQKMVVHMYLSEDRVYKADKTIRLVSAADAQHLASEVFDNRCAASGTVDNLTWRRFNRG